MKEFKIDVPVLLIFFVRDDVLKRTFEAIRRARPSVLLLWQDGPRKDHPGDLEGIEKCREVVGNIDWDCKVYTNFHEENMGCDPSTFRAHKWAFSIVEKCIVLEDDMVPSQSFFVFCKELLDKYEHDERINHICGVNYIENMSFCPNDYLFSFYGTGAWASWRRVAKGWDEKYSFLDDSYSLKNLSREMPKLFPEAYGVAVQRKSTGYEWWETILGFDCHLNHRLVIIPKKNLVTNIGVTAEATHGSSLRLMPARVRKAFYMEAHELSFPLRHPKYVVPDYDFMNEMSKVNCFGRPLRKMFRKVVYIFKLLLYGEFLSFLKRKFSRK